jgi:hypothetical protein
VPDDVGGPPLPNGEGPDSFDRGAADEAFAAVVLDEAFVEAAEIHEPTAAERILYAALERAEAEAAGEAGFYRDPDLDPGGADGLLDGIVPLAGDPDGGAEAEDDEGRFDRSDYLRYLPEEDDEDEPGYGEYGPYSASYPAGYRPAGRSGAVGSVGSAGPVAAAGPGWRPRRWQRPVACVLAMVMGISVIAFALIAIQRAGSSRGTAPAPAPPASAPDRPPAMDAGSG